MLVVREGYIYMGNVYMGNANWTSNLAAILYALSSIE